MVILCDKHPYTYASLMGVHGAGAAFVCLDDTAPTERNRSLIARVRAKAAITTARWASEIDDLVDQIACVDKPYSFQRGRMPTVGELSCTERSWIETDPTALAYVAFTSGTSGAPKGVQVERRSLDRFSAAMEAVTTCNATARVTQGARLSFDAALQQVIMAFTAGATLVPVPDEVRTDGELMCEWLDRQAITHWDSVPSLWALVVGVLGGSAHQRLKKLETVVLGGETLRAADVKVWQRAVPTAALINVYGPTEATINVTAFTVPARFDAEAVPIGYPLDGVEAEIIDAAGARCEPYIVGEIYIRGHQVARGYLNDDAASANAFTTSHDQQRVYRTGDLGYHLVDGSIICTGRRDTQVKINGVRIELAEIESALASVDGVNEALVTVTTPAQGTPIRLAAAVVGAPNCTVAQIRSHIGRMLPASMQPATIVRVQEIPRVPSGKVNTRALQTLFDDRLEASATDDEAGEPALPAVLAACREILGHEIGPSTDLVERGLDSISALRLRTALIGQGIEIDGADLFSHPTAADLSRRSKPVTVQKTDQVSQSLRDRRDTERTTGPVLPTQKPILAAVLGRGRRHGTGLVQEVDHYDRRLDSTVVEIAARELIRRTEAFMASIELTPGSIASLKVDHSAADRFRPTVIEESGGDFGGRVQRLADGAFEDGCDISAAPLLRLCLVRSPERSALIWTMHHLVTDGWSWELASREFCVLYQAISCEGPLPDPKPVPSFDALSSGTGGRPESGDLDSVLASLRDVVSPTAYVDDTRRPAGRCDHKKLLECDVSRPESAALEVAARSDNVTLSAVLLHAAGCAVARVMSHPDICLGLISSGRNVLVPGIADVVAPLARATPIGFRARSETPRSVHRLIQAVLRLESFDVASALEEAGVQQSIRYPQWTFVHQNYRSGIRGATAAKDMGFNATRSYGREAANSALAIVAQPSQHDSMTLRVEYWPSLVHETLARRVLHETYRELRRSAHLHD